MKNKEWAVYEAVGRLLRSGRDTTGLTVSDIAREAGVGKGTVYGYFTTKEELIAKALAYNLQTEAEDLLEAMSSASTLDEKIHTVLYRIDAAAPAHMLLADAFASMSRILFRKNDGCLIADTVLPVLRRVVLDLSRTARQESVLAEEAPEELAEIALINVLAGYSFMSHVPGLRSGMSAEQHMRLTTEMVRAGLAVCAELKEREDNA